MKKFAKIMSLVIIVVMSLALLVSCAPNSDPDKAKAALDKNGYSGIKKDATVLAVVGMKGAQTVVFGAKVSEESSDFVFIIYFKDAQSADSSFERAQKSIKTILDLLKIDYSGEDSDIVTKKSGAMIYSGTEAGIKAAR